MKKSVLLLIFILSLFSLIQAESDYDRSLVYILNIDGPIGTVTADRVIEAVDFVEEESADLLVISMDTPGGLSSSIWPITKAIMNSSVPVVVYVSPTGAKAASAGVFITYAAHLAAMAPGCNIGAAHVVSMGGEIDSIMSEKLTNDAVASLKAMAERNGRNAEWAEMAARKSVSITSQEALENKVINLMAANIDELLEKIDGDSVNTVFGYKIIKSSRADIHNIEITLIQSLLEIISSPDIIFILFSLGGLGLVLELYNPGSILPGVVGAICIILAFYGMRTLPINYAGLFLIILAIILFILEIKIVSHGLLTIGGVMAMIIGGMMLVDTADPSLKISKTIIFAVALVVGGFVIVAFYYAYKARITQPTTGGEGLVGKVGVVQTKIDHSGYIRLDGELWEALADEIIETGAEVTVVAVDNLKVKVIRKS